MSVVAVYKIQSQTSPGSGRGHRKYRSQYQVITDDVTDGSITVIEETRGYGPLHLPQVGEYYEWLGDTDLWAYVVAEPEVRLRNVTKSRKVWDVVIEHTTESTKRDNTTPMGNPLSEPWTFNRVADEWTEEAQKDSITGKPIANSAHQPFTGKDVEIIRVRPGYELEKNFLNMEQDKIEATEGHVNDGLVIIKGKAYPARHLFLRPITVQELHHESIGSYYRHKFRIDTRKNGFDITLVDRGTKYLAGTDKTNPQHFTDVLDPVTGNPIPAPGLPLDGDGALLSAAEIAAGNLTELTFTKEPVGDFDVWGFPA